MNISENHSQVVRYWWNKAEHSIESAQRELDAGELSYAMNRIYYSVFYAVSAALLERGLSFKRHSGVRHTFHREFIKSGLIESEWAKFYDRLFEDRQEGDYMALITFEREYVEKQLIKGREFLEQIRPFINSLK
jgi:uncharacterized protein (UPF0332 family)